MYSGIAPGAASAIVMYRQDGRLLARYPHNERSVGQSFAVNAYFKALRATGKKFIVVRDTGTISGVDLLIAGRSLINYPVLIIVIRTVSAILAPWRKQGFYLLGSGLVLELIVDAAGLLVLRQMRGQRLLTDALSAGTEAPAARLRAEAGLAIADERERGDRATRLQNGRFAAALGHMSYALCMFDNEDRLIVVNNQWTTMFGYTAEDGPAGTSLRRVLELGTVVSHLLPAPINAFIYRNDMFKVEGVPTYTIRGLPDGRTLVMRFAPVVGDGWLLTYEQRSSGIPV